MRINFNRMSQLAGLPADSNGKSLYEGKDHKTDAEEGMEMHEEEETATYEGTALDGLDEMDAEDDLPEMDHMAGYMVTTDLSTVAKVILIKVAFYLDLVLKDNLNTSTYYYKSDQHDIVYFCQRSI